MRIPPAHTIEDPERIPNAIDNVTTIHVESQLKDPSEHHAHMIQTFWESHCARILGAVTHDWKRDSLQIGEQQELESVPGPRALGPGPRPRARDTQTPNPVDPRSYAMRM